MTRDVQRPIRDAWIVEAVRTPIGRYGGALASVRSDDLAAAAIRAVGSSRRGRRWASSLNQISIRPFRWYRLPNTFGSTRKANRLPRGVLISSRACTSAALSAPGAV